MSECLCCNGTLLRHIRSGKIYWFCVDCRQEMPDMSSVVIINPYLPQYYQQKSEENNFDVGNKNSP